MTDHSKKYGFLPPLPRRFTPDGKDAWTLINFQEAEDASGETAPFERPDNWSVEATALFASEAAAPSIPATTRTIEENTVPSWLWQHTSEGKQRAAETSAKQVFDRVVGTAVYAGWKIGLLTGEADARTFFDEARYALAQRFVALDARALSRLGLDWAYGQKTSEQEFEAFVPPASIDVPNVTVDAVVGGRADKDIRAQWQRLTPSPKTQTVTARFSDIASDWDAASSPGMKAMIDLAALRASEGPLDIEALRHATRILVILCDLHDLGENLEIGFCNFAPLLMSLTLPYDSAAARAYAAAITALITAEAYATSAELASLRGASAGFTTGHETILRTLRNRRRAAYGDRSDYEKISVLPAPLQLNDCPDLTLAAVVRERWDDVLAMAQKHGLRQTHVTSLLSSPALTLFMESTAQGIEPLPSLRITRAEGEDVFRRDVHGAVKEALSRLDYSASEAQTIIRHIVGHGTLEKAPGVNPTSLRVKGFDAAAIERVENYLPYVDNIRLAFTPWIVGEEFCRATLKIPAQKMESPRFELLQHLGFSVEAIAAANAFCYGHGTACNVNALRLKHISVFTRGEEILPEARIRMAAAVQSFVSGDIALTILMPTGTPAERSEKLLLGAWRQGLKSLTLEHVPAPAPTVAEDKPRSPAASPFLHAKKPALPARKTASKATSRLVGLAKGKSHSTEGKRR